MFDRKWLSGMVVALVVAGYAGLYAGTVERRSSPARGAGDYCHYREVSSDWQAYVFYPAAWVEWRLIRLFPESFLDEASWAELRQTLVLQAPDKVFLFTPHH